MVDCAWLDQGTARWSAGRVSGCDGKGLSDEVRKAMRFQSF